MPRNPIDSVEIVEPPIRELSKTRSSFKRGCLSGCLFVVIFILIGFGLIKLFIGSGPSTISSVPANFPRDIPVYDPDNITAITLIPGKYKYRSTEIAAIFPKVLLSPVILRTQGMNQSEIPSSTNSGLASFRDIWRIISTPVSNLDDTVEIEWHNLDAEPEFIYNYYKKELGKKNYAVADEFQDIHTQQHFTFSRGDGLNGYFLVEGNEEAGPGTNYAALTVEIPEGYKPPVSVLPQHD